MLDYQNFEQASVINDIIGITHLQRDEHTTSKLSMVDCHVRRAPGGLWYGY